MTMRRRSLQCRVIAISLCVVLTILISATLFLDSGVQLKPVKLFDNLNIPRPSLRRVVDLNCKAIFANNKEEIDKAKQLMQSKLFKTQSISDNKYIEMTKSCDYFKTIRGYINYSHVTQEERDFPIAYSILLYKDVEQAERLLRAIYRPHNVYCLHVDADSKPIVKEAVKHIADCFPNVFEVSRKEFIVYAGYSRLQADINCMSDLLQSKIQWKYFINQPSQQFPIKTNEEIVKILKVYNGSNDIEGLTGAARLDSRIKYRHHYKYLDTQSKPKIFKTNQKKGEPPYNITIVKGSAYGVFSRGFVQFIIESKIARALLDYLRDVYSPDEYYWATLNHNPHIGAPGSYKGDPPKKPWLATYASWGGRDPCKGKFVRGVCVFGVGDLYYISKLNYLFVNKFYLDYQPIALQCMEEWYFNKTFTQSGPALNLTYYKSLPFIRR